MVWRFLGPATTVKSTLPRSRRASRRGPARKPAKGGTAHGKIMRRILIVDDSSMVRSSLRSWFENSSEWQVCGEAENGKVAVEKVEELHPDVVILDLQMPVMNGLEAAREIKRLSPTTAIIIFTVN